MSNPIINVTPPTPPTPEQRLQNQAKALVNQQNRAFSQLGQIYQVVLQFIWSDPATAQAKFDAFTAAGFNASGLLTNAVAYQTLYQTVTGVALASPLPEGYSLQPNQDGTVTVNYTAPAQ